MKSVNEYLLKNNVNKRLRLSCKLLEHSTLLTPVLKREFGEMKASESQRFQCMESSDTYLRESELRQESTGNVILEATLRIMKNELPNSFIKDLKTTSMLFGDLLIKHKVKVRVSDQQIILHFDSNNGNLRMGRSHTMYLLSTNKVVCHVRELLVCEQELITSKNEYKNMRVYN